MFFLQIEAFPVSNIVNSIFLSPVFQTERLVVGQWSLELAEPALRIYGDPLVTKWIGGISEDSIESMRDRLNALIERNQKWPKCWGSWPVFSKQSRELLGALLMKPLPDGNGELTTDIEIGWHLSRDCWGNGFASEGGRKLIEIAFDELDVPELFAVTRPDNTRSQNVALRLGMAYQGRTDAYYGQTLDLFKISNPAH